MCAARAGPPAPRCPLVTWQLRLHSRTYLQLGLLEGVNSSLYAAALAIGPAPVVVALPLTSPIMLLLLAVRTGKLPVSVWET